MGTGSARERRGPPTLLGNSQTAGLESRGGAGLLGPQFFGLWAICSVGCLVGLVRVSGSAPEDHANKSQITIGASAWKGRYG